MCCVSCIVALRLLCRLPNAHKERDLAVFVLCSHFLPLQKYLIAFPFSMLTLVHSCSICCYTLAMAKERTGATCEDRSISLVVMVLGARNVWALLCCLWSERRHWRRFPVFSLKDRVVIPPSRHCSVSDLSLNWQEVKLKLSYSKV